MRLGAAFNHGARAAMPAAIITLEKGSFSGSAYRMPCSWKKSATSVMSKPCTAAIASGHAGRCAIRPGRPSQPTPQCGHGMGFGLGPQRLRRPAAIDAAADNTVRSSIVISFPHRHVTFIPPASIQPLPNESGFDTTLFSFHMAKNVTAHVRGPVTKMFLNPLTPVGCLWLR